RERVRRAALEPAAPQSRRCLRHVNPRLPTAGSPRRTLSPSHHAGARTRRVGTPPTASPRGGTASPRVRRFAAVRGVSGLPVALRGDLGGQAPQLDEALGEALVEGVAGVVGGEVVAVEGDRKSTRLNSSHVKIS